MLFFTYGTVIHELAVIHAFFLSTSFSVMYQQALLQGLIVSAALWDWNKNTYQVSTLCRVSKVKKKCFFFYGGKEENGVA